MRFVCENDEGEQLVGDLSDADASTCFVLCHGLGAFRKLGLIDRLYNRLSEQGLAVCAFDFSGNGESEGSFAKATIQKEAKDLRTVIDALEQKGYQRFIVVGHSLGGAVALMHQAEDSRVQAVVALAAPVDFPRSLKANKDWLSPGRYMPIPDVKGVRLPDRDRTLDEQWFRDVRAAQISVLRCRVIGVYGMQDTIVSPFHATLLKELGGEVESVMDDHNLLRSVPLILERIVSLENA